MSRFGDARWQRLAVWSGAALAWGSTVTAVILEPARVAPVPPGPQVEASTAQASLPAQPETGLLVIRYQSDTPGTNQPAPVAPAPAPAAASAPQTTSSGS